MKTVEPENATESSDNKPGGVTGSTESGLRKRPLPPTEVGGRAGPDPTRYGDWEKDGRCIDF